MLDVCTWYRHRLSDQRSKSPGQLGTTMLNKLRAFNLSRTVYTILIILNGMIKRVAVGEKLEFVNRTINKAQTVPK